MPTARGRLIALAAGLCLGVVASLLPAANVRFVSSFSKPSWDESSRGKPSISTATAAAQLNATVSFISDRAEFTAPVLYSKENRAKLVYLVEAKPAADVAAKLNAGQPIDVLLPKSS